MKDIVQYINENANNYIKEIKESENVAENFIKNINKFVDSTISNLPIFDNSHINNDNCLSITLKSEDKFDTYHINIYGIDDEDNYGYDFKYLPKGTKNVFMVSFLYSSFNTSGVTDELYEFIKKKDKKVADSYEGYDGFDRGGWDEGFYTIYPINNTTIKYLKDCLTEYCKKIK